MISNESDLSELTNQMQKVKEKIVVKLRKFDFFGGILNFTLHESKTILNLTLLSRTANTY